MRLRLWVVVVAVWAALPCLAAETADPQREVAVRLKDGSTLVGRIVSEDERALKVVTRSGVEVDVPRASVESVEDADAAQDRRPIVVPSPVVDDTRLFFGPTGRPLRKGAGYVSDHFLFFPGVAYGVTDNVTLAGGVSLIPGVGLDEQAFYFTPKVGARFGERAALSVGGLLAHAGGSDDGAGLGIGYVAGSWGSEDNSVTAGIGWGRGGEDFDDTESQPMVMVGGLVRLSTRISLMSENWFFPGEEFNLLMGGLRFRGDRLTVDVGLCTSGEILDETEGWPAFPWLSFSYHFSLPRPRK